MKAESLSTSTSIGPDFAVDWRRLARTFLTSRALDALEENRLAPQRKVLYQFSARGHELVQTLLGQFLDRAGDGVSAYYRSRPLMLTLGVSVEDALAAPLARSGGYSDGRDIGVVCNLPRRDGPTVLPMAGDVGSQFTPAAGWAQALVYRRERLGEKELEGCIAVAQGGDAAAATNGFWSSLTIASTLRLPLLFCIEDNGYGISVPSSLQTPGGNIARNLRSFGNLRVSEGDGTDPEEALREISEAVVHVRSGRGPALARLRVPRLCGHSGQDTQTYKGARLLEEERRSDPLIKLRDFLIPDLFSQGQWEQMEKEVEKEVAAACEKALERAEPDPASARRHVFCETLDDGSPDLQRQGGIAPEGISLPSTSDQPEPELDRINLLTAVRRTLERELEVNPRLLIFGEDVGPKGGVHAATLGLQDKFGEDRVFDTSLSEEGIIGRAVGMALAGLTPVPEIQFRKYADPAAEQLNNCGTIRWRTANGFAAPVVVRMPGGFAKVGDPWHSVSGESLFAHAVGWRVACPSNAEDAVGLLRTALRGNDPTIFFEHRALLDAASARRPYPGDDFALPFGRARLAAQGNSLTIVSWGAMVDRCLSAVERAEAEADVVDLRTIRPWDRGAVLRSVGKTKRCLIVHEDGSTCGFGAEIAAVLIKEAFFDLDAPIERLAVPDVPIPHNVGLMNAILPDVSRIVSKIREIVEF